MNAHTHLGPKKITVSVLQIMLLCSLRQEEAEILD
jgi:hypothetical protein